MGKHIGKSAILGENYVLGKNVVIQDNVEIGDDAYIGNNVVIHPNTKIGRNVRIEDGAILGRLPRSGSSSTRKVRKDLPPLEIGDDCIIGTNAVIYTGNRIGNGVMIGDLASIREQNIIGDYTIIGRAVMLEYENVIGKSVVLHVCSGMGSTVVDDEVFIGAHVLCTNDNLMGRLDQPFRGSHIKRRARIGSNTTLLPGITIGEDAVVGVGSVVTEDIPDRTIALGSPARIIKDVPEDQLKKRASFQA